MYFLYCQAHQTKKHLVTLGMFRHTFHVLFTQQKEMEHTETIFLS